MMSKQTYSREALVDLWKFFLQAFKDPNDSDKTTFGTYFNRIMAMRIDDSSRLVVDYNDLATYVNDNIQKPEHEKAENLMELVLQDPDEARETLKMAVVSILSEVDQGYLAEIERNVRGDFKGIPLIKEIPDLNIDDVDRPLAMDAIVMEADERGRADIISFAWQCEEGHTTRTNESRKPARCAGAIDDHGERQQCDSQYFRQMKKLHEKLDYIELKVQQRLDRIDEKKSSIDIEMMATGRDLVKFVIKKLQLADYCTINGIVRLKESRFKGRDGHQIADLYIEASDFEIKPESSLTEYDPAYTELVKLAVTEENEDPDFEKLLRSVCPSYKGGEHDIIKLALLLLAVGADERKNRDGTRLRGEIQICLLGDKGTAKSLLAKWLKNMRPRSFYTSGSKTSSVSLVGGMKRDDPDRPMRVFTGIFGIADLVIIDELEKRKPEELDALAEPMQDSQSLHIGRGGENREQDITVAVLACANPADKLAKYDINKDIFTNTKLPAWLLDRFDCIFIMRDVPNKAKDEALFEHIISTRKQSKSRQQFEEGRHDFKRLADDFYPLGYMKQWCTYVRETFHPSVAESPEALEIIHKFFNEYRKLNIRQPKSKEEKDNWTKDYEMPAVQWRTLQSLLRFSEASARAHHRNKVLPKDAEIAVSIIRTSIASSGMNNFSEIKMEEAEIDEIESRMNDVAQREFIRKQYRDANYDAKMFYKGLAHISWEKCDPCHSDGFKLDGTDRVTCDYCQGVGGKPQPFDISQLKEICREKNVLANAFNAMWKQCIREKWIVPDEDMPGLYWNKRKDEDVAHFTQMYKSAMNMESADSLYVKAIKAKHEPLRAEIDKIADAEEYDA